MEMALRTPLNTIIGYSELLLEDSDSVVDIDNFVSDINKITESGRMLEKELEEKLQPYIKQVEEEGNA